MNIPLKTYTVVSDPNTGAQIVILKDEQNTALLPIWIGEPEGNAIRFALEGISPQRPLTHDLLRDIFNHLDIQMEKVVITGMSDNTYFATLHLIPNRSSVETAQVELVVDARPSDAIALALRMGVPIYATEEVLQKTGSEALDAWLEKLKPKDFGPHNT